MKKLALIVAATAAVALTSAANAGAPRAVDNFASAIYSGPTGQLAHANGVDHSVSTPTGFDPVVGPVFNSNGFEAPGYTPGNLIGQNSWVVQNVAPATSAYTVGTTSGVGGTAGVTANAVGTSFAFPTTALVTPGAGEGVSVNADIGRTVQAVAANGTTRYAIDMYSSTAEVFRIGLTRGSATTVNLFVTAPFNTTSSTFQAGQPVFNVTISTGLTPGGFYNLESRLNYATQTVDIYSNNALFFGGIPFITAGSGGAGTQTNFSDADLNIAVGLAADNGFFDNYVVKTIAVPEPMTLSALAFGGSLLGRRRRA